MKRFIGISLALLLVLACFAACSPSASDDTASDDTAADSGTADSGTADSDTADEGSDDQGASGYTKPDGSEIKIGLSLGTMQQERWGNEANWMQEWADENGVEFMVQTADDDAQKQITQCEDMITKGVDVLMICAKDNIAAAPVVAACEEAGIPCIMYEHTIMNVTYDQLYSIRGDSVECGEYMATMVLDAIGNEGNVIWLKGSQDDLNTHLYIEGQQPIIDELTDSGAINVVYTNFIADWNSDNAYDQAEAGLLAADNDVKGIIAPNDNTAGAIIEAIKAAGLDPTQIPVGGQDAEIAALQRIVEGTQIGTCFRDFEYMAKTAIQMAVYLAMDDQDSVDEMIAGNTSNNDAMDVPVVLIPNILVTKDNMVETIIKPGVRTMEEVYENIPEDEWPTVE